MSADNGIYILKTKDHQFRVIHTTAIENLYWDGEKYTQDLQPSSIVDYFGSSPFTYKRSLALHIARKMANKAPSLEYGITLLFSDKTWAQILREAKPATA